MELYIRIVNGQPFEHPILGDNFRQAFPDVDTNNLPADFARFTRVPKPEVTVFQVVSAQPTYQWVDGGVQDVWEIRDMTAEEKAELIARVIASKPFPSWTVDEENLMHVPPIPYPSDESKFYNWNEETQQWEEIIPPTE